LLSLWQITTNNKDINTAAPGSISWEQPSSRNYMMFPIFKDGDMTKFKRLYDLIPRLYENIHPEDVFQDRDYNLMYTTLCSLESIVILSLDHKPLPNFIQSVYRSFYTFKDLTTSQEESTFDFQFRKFVQALKDEGHDVIVSEPIAPIVFQDRQKDRFTWTVDLQDPFYRKSFEAYTYQLTNPPQNARHTEIWLDDLLFNKSLGENIEMEATLEVKKFITTKHPLTGINQLLVCYNTPEKYTWRNTGDVPAYFTGTASFKSQAAQEELAQIKANFHIRRPHYFESSPDLTQISRRVQDVQRQNVFTLPEDFSIVKFPQTLPNTIPETIAKSQVSVEESDTTFISAIRNYLDRVVAIDDEDDLIQFDLVNVPNRAIIATLYYNPKIEEFMIFNQPTQNSDRYVTLRKLTYEQIGINNIRKIPKSISPGVSTDTSRWENRVIPDSDKVTGFNGTYMSKSHIKKGEAVIAVRLEAEAAMLAGGVASIGGGIEEAIAKLFAGFAAYHTMNDQQKAQFEQEAKMLNAKYQNSLKLQQDHQQFLKEMQERRFEVQGQSTEGNQSLRAGLGSQIPYNYNIRTSTGVNTEGDTSEGVTTETPPASPETSAITTPAIATVPKTPLNEEKPMLYSKLFQTPRGRSIALNNVPSPDMIHL